MTTLTQVPFVDLARQFRDLEDDLTAAFKRVAASGAYVFGSDLEAFEREIATLCGVKHALGVANGTDAIILALRVFDIGVGDEVITAPNSFIATAGAIAMAGAVPRFADVSDDLNIDPAALEAAITDRTKAIIPVHLTGRPADMNPINDIAAKHGLKVIEDAAQAIGATYHGRAVGGLGDVASFSLHPLKNLGLYGDAGFITTNDNDLALRLRGLRNHGLIDRDTCAEWGMNSRLDNLQAALARVKLRHLDEWTERIRQIAGMYRAGLSNVLTTPQEAAHEWCVYHNFVVFADRREELILFLREYGVDTKVHYPILLHLQPAAKNLRYRTGDFPKAEELATKMLSLPIYPELTDDEVAHVITGIVAFYT